EIGESTALVHLRQVKTARKRDKSPNGGGCTRKKLQTRLKKTGEETITPREGTQKTATPMQFHKRTPAWVPPVLFAVAWMCAARAQAADTHEVRSTPGKARVGEQSLVSVTIQGKAGWHVNEEAPIVLQVMPGPYVTVDKLKFGRPDLAESTQDHARFD